MAVAYAVALQVLLTSVLATQNAAALTSPDFDHFGVICTGSGDSTDDQGKSRHDPRHQSCVLCTIGTGSAAPPPTPEIPNERRDASALPHEAATPAAFIAPHPTPRLSQGPPQNT